MKGLFSQWPISGWFHKRLEDVKQSVGEVPAHQVRQGDLTALVAELTTRHSVHAPRLIDARVSHQQSETTIQVNERSHLAFEHGAGAKVDAIRLQVLVPYEGEQDLLRSMPASQIPLRSVEGQITGNRIVLTYTYPTSEAEGVRAFVEDWFRRLREKLGVIQTEVDQFNAQLPKVISTMLARRVNALSASQVVSDALGFPLHRREETPEVYPVPLQRKVLPSSSKTVSKGSPEWMLEISDYEEILGIFAAMSKSMERMPAAFAGLEEEEIRAFFLAYLNARYQGTATGETFNASGKTDIIVQVEGQNVFVAECKIWKGAAAFAEALDQLLGYLTWRDTKTAIVIFNRNKNLTTVLKQIPGLVGAHPAYAGGAGQQEETRFQYLLRHPQDAERLLTVTVLVFDVPSTSDPAAAGP